MTDRNSAYDLVEEEISRLEERLTCPGTQIIRVNMDNSLVQQEGLHVKNPHSESTWVWCVAWGPSYLRHNFTYGNTIRQAVERALKQIEEGVV